ncbi:MAG TPA: TetR/AcrR family transcriptional regulator [Methanobacterium sp.]
MDRCITDNHDEKTTKKTVEERILDAAMIIFSKNGYNGATTIKIAEKAEVNEITIFRKFKSKENLLKTVIQKNLMETLETLDYILCKEKSADVEICIKTLAITLKQFLDERMDFLFMMATEGRKRPEMMDLSTQFRRKLIEHLSGYFLEQMNQGNIRKVDPDLLAITLFSFIFNKSLSEKIYDEYLLKDDLKAFEEYADIFMRGIII